MWNIRSHARRFPVHTGTLIPSIAHPNRFLNHLKRFSAGFLTFRGGKIKKCTVSGDKINDFECAPGSWLALSVKPYRACQLSQRESPWHNGKVSGQTVKSAVPERTVTLSVTAYAVPAPPKGGAFSAGGKYRVRWKASACPFPRIKLPLRGSCRRQATERVFFLTASLPVPSGRAGRYRCACAAFQS